MVCVLATAAITFGLVNWIGQRTHVMAKQCRIGTFNLDMASGDIQKIADVIRQEGLEIVVLEELGKNTLQALSERLTSHTWKYLVTPQTVNKRVGVLFQSDTVLCSNAKTIPLHTQEHYQQRDALVVSGKVLPSGFDFTLVVVHLKEGKEPGSAALRQEQLKVLHQWIVNQLDSKDPSAERDIILAGDFNTPLLMNQEDFQILDGGIGLYVVQQDAGEDLYSDYCDIAYKNPVDFIVITPDCRAEYIDNTARFGSYDSQGEKTVTSDHRVTWADFSNDDLDNPNRTPLDTSDSALVLEMTATVQRGQEITVKATTFRDAKCTMRTIYESGSTPTGKTTVSSQESKDGKEEWKWTWTVGGSTNQGIATVQVQATWAWGHALKRGFFKVLPKSAPSTDTE